MPSCRWTDLPSELRRSTLYVVVIVALCVSALPPAGRSAQAQDSSRTINGFVVSGRFLAEWSRQGSNQASVYVNGLPISPRRPEISLADGRTYEVQWFERARYEAHPQNPPPYDVLLGRLGAAQVEGRGALEPSTGRPRIPSDLPFVGIPKPADADGRGKLWFPETRHSISGKILEYWQRYGGLKQFGFPLSEPFQEVSRADGRPYTVQYFERNRFELHPGKAPPYEVELGLLGVEQFKRRAVPSDQLPIAPPKGVRPSKDRLVIAMSHEPASLFSLFENNFVAHAAAEPIYDGLVNRDASDNVYPEVAWYAPTIENGGAYYVGTGDHRHLVVTYKLRTGAVWSDGWGITAADVLFHHKLVLDPKAPVADRTLHEKVFSVDALDAHTVTFTFMSSAQAASAYARSRDKEYFSFLKKYADERLPVTDQSYALVGGLLPAHVLGRIAPDKLRESQFARKPIGNGPFMVERWDVGREIVLAQNPRYNLTAKPLIREITIKIMPDVSQIRGHLVSGSLDAVMQDVFAAPSQSLSRIGDHQKVDYAPGRTSEMVLFNLDHPILGHKAIRQAIAHAINRQKLVDEVTLGRGAIMHSFVPPASRFSMADPGFAKDWEGMFPLARYDYDPARAEQLLDQAGWAKGTGGIRAKDDVRLTLELAFTSASTAREQIGQSLVADLKQVGVELKLKTVPRAEFSAAGGYLSKREHDMVRLELSLDQDPGELALAFSSRNIPSAENGYKGGNYSGYRNPRFDALARTAADEIDQSKRAAMFAEMQRLWSEDLPGIVLYSPPVIGVHKVTLVNWETPRGTTPATYKVAAMYFK